MSTAPAHDSDPTLTLRDLADVASRIGADAIAADAIALADRVAEGRLYVACLGQFKRGKSTLLNALVGEPVLPTGVVPVTSAVTIVRAGTGPSARIYYEDRQADDVPTSRLPEYVTEAGNPGNVKGVTAVEVFHPSALLHTGVCLVDTPGVGSSSPLAGDVTRQFVPHIDAALVVLGADPPISGEELRLLEEVSRETGEFIFAINKADKLTDTELVEVVVFTQRLLAERLGVVPEALFVVSAAERLKRGEATRDWARLEAALTNLAREAKAAVLLQRADSTIRRLGAQLVQALTTAHYTLQAPLEATDRRVKELRAWRDQAERALVEFRVLLEMDQQKVAQGLRNELMAHMAQTRAATVSELAAALDQAATRRFLSWGAAFPVAQGVARHRVQQALSMLEERASRAYQETTGRFIDRANAFLSQLATVESAIGEMPPLTQHTELGGKRRFYFTELMTLTSSNPLQILLDRFGPSSQRRRRIEARAEAYLMRLLETNASRVVNDLDERLRDSRHDLETEIRSRLTELVASAERAADRARELRAAGEAAVGPELVRLASLREHVDAILSGGGHPAPPRDREA
jgi:GTP-binding protein EngB required for normal cell division